MPTGQYIDNSYFVERYLSQTLTDYSTLIKELQSNNKVAYNTQLALEKCVKQLSQIPSDMDWASLSQDQKDQINEAIKATNVAQREVYSQIKPIGKKTNPAQDKQARSSWNLIKRCALDLGMYIGTLSGKKGDFAPKALTGTLPVKARNQMTQYNQNQGAINQDVVRKARALQAKGIYPPAPANQKGVSGSQPPMQENKESLTEKIQTVATSILNGGQAFINALSEFVGQVGQSYSTMMSAFGDILDSPLQSAIGMIDGLSQAMSQGFKIIGDTIQSVVGAISGIFDSFFKADDEKGNKKAQIQTALVTSVMNIVTSLLNVVVQSIQQGFNIFASTLQAIFKIVKKVQNQSPIIRQILDLLNLAFTLFFMPFMNQFALTLLEKVVELLDWAVETGDKFASLGGSLLQTLQEGDFKIEDILQAVKNIAEGFVTKFLPSILELIPELLNFAIDFASTILENKEDIINFIKVGLQAFTDLLSAGVLTEFLKFGTDTMKWIQNNAGTITKFLATVLNQALNIASFFMGFVGGGNEDVRKLMDYKGQLNQQALIDSFATFGMNQDTSDEAIVNQYNEMAQGHSVHQAQGGKFVKTINGGIPVLAGEANENEYKFSEKELEEIGKDTTVTIQYNGQILSRNDFKEVIRNTVSDISNKSYFR